MKREAAERALNGGTRLMNQWKAQKVEGQGRKEKEERREERRIDDGRQNGSFGQAATREREQLENETRKGGGKGRRIGEDKVGALAGAAQGKCTPAHACCCFVLS